MVANGTWVRPNADQEYLIMLDEKVNKLKKGFKKAAPKTDSTKKTNSQTDAPKAVHKEDKWK